MRKFLSIILILCCSLLVTPPIFAQTNEQPNVTVTIQSPVTVKEYPGFETNIKAIVTNNTDQAIPDTMAYITMANTVKHWTVNLEDYSADQPITIGTLKPHEEKMIELPIRFVYTDKYKLYVTASSDQESAVYSSDSITVDILGNTKIEPLIVEVIAIAIPLLLLIWMLAETYRARIKR